jgi:tripartite-type tricarboxylate transporter receptor subunit TctC
MRPAPLVRPLRRPGRPGRIALGLAALALALAGRAAAQPAGGPGPAWPQKPIHVLVGFPAGASGDILIRIMAPALGEGLGEQIIVENRPGAGSSLAAEAVAHAPADGYTLLLSTIANTINPSLYTLAFDFSRDLAPISLLAEIPGILAAHPSAPASLQALIAEGRAHPDALQYASAGTGTVTHLYGELFNAATGTHLAHVPYKGSSQALTDLLAGRVSLLFSPASTVLQPIRAGRLRALAVIGAAPLAALPGVPTLKEAGIPGFESGLWFGLNAPQGTPAAVVERLNREAARVLALPAVAAQLQAQSLSPEPGSPASFGAFIARDTARWAQVVRSAGIRAD